MWSWLYPMYKLLGTVSVLINCSQSVNKSTLLYNNLESGNTCIIKCTGNTHSEEYHMISNVDHCEVIFTYHQSNWQFHILNKYFNILVNNKRLLQIRCMTFKCMKTVTKKIMQKIIYIK